ncbi:MAG TPA: GNAT family N-acetyltransferase [Anaerolineaceae bacterium]
MIIRKAAPADMMAIFNVRTKSWRSSYTGILPSKYLASLDSQDSLKEWKADLDAVNHHLVTFIAEDDQHNIVGYAMAGPEKDGDPIFGSELYAIYLLDPYQHRGVGTQLVQAVAAELIQQGYQAMLVWALSANPTRAFYEKMGGVLVDQKEILLGGSNYTEVAYGWRDIRLLAGFVPAAQPGD